MKPFALYLNPVLQSLGQELNGIGIQRRQQKIQWWWRMRMTLK
jgi:hypothetical protein